MRGLSEGRKKGVVTPSNIRQDKKGDDKIKPIRIALLTIILILIISEQSISLWRYIVLVMLGIVYAILFSIE